MRELLPRTLTAVAFIAVVTGLLVFSKSTGSPWGVALLLGGVVLICTVEYVYLVNRWGYQLEGNALSALNVLFGVSPLFFGGRYWPWALALALLWPWAWDRLRGATWRHTLLAWASVLYFPVLLQFSLWVYLPVYGGYYLLFLLCSVWAYDIIAFFAGSFWGRQRLLPELSPKKTWEGAWGGAAGAFLVALSAPLWVPNAAWNLQWLVFLPLALSVATQAGDLFESWLKRNAGVKDAGAILPGHGGLLDRVDGLLFAFPVYFVYLKFVLGLI